MHFQLFFYLKLHGTKETVLADQQAEKNIDWKKLVQNRYYQQWPSPLVATLLPSMVTINDGQSDH